MLTQFKLGAIPLSLDLQYCKIGDYGLEQLLEPVILTLHTLACTTTEIQHSDSFCLHLNGNLITHKSVEKLKHVLTSKGNVITNVNLSDNFDTSMTNKYIVFKHLIECLSHKQCSLRVINICASGFTEQHMYHLVSALVLGLLFSAQP